MDDEAALLARRVALAASAWMKQPTDAGVYARLVAAVAEWDAYVDPTFDDADELLDGVADTRPPRPLGDLMPGISEALRASARREL